MLEYLLLTYFCNSNFIYKKKKHFSVVYDYTHYLGLSKDATRLQHTCSEEGPAYNCCLAGFLCFPEILLMGIAVRGCGCGGLLTLTLFTAKTRVQR